MTLGRVQIKIMRVLWLAKSATARQITRELGKTEPIAHSTVQTLLRKMEAKGAVGHRVDDRAFVYEPLVAERDVAKSAAHEILMRVFNGSVYGLVSHLMAQEQISGEERERLRRLIDESR